ncbi:MAG TPA: hypothetical protein VER96_13320 [Polyangiaceae bacterium]|nr:hypothetical protein [Polyangiaceae bacterium]
MVRKAKRKARAGRQLNAKQIEERLLATSFPRLHMMLILALAAVGTFLCSAMLVRCGLRSMGVRYALAVVGGYVSFLSFVRVWIAYQTRNWKFGRQKPQASERRDYDGDVPDGLGDALSRLDVPDLSALEDLGNLASSAGQAFSGGGGSFGGGGASASWDVDLGSGDSGASDALDAVSGSDDALPIVIAVIALLGGVVALGFVVYSSPVLFAEVLLDVAVLGAVYKKNQRHQRSHWAAGVLGRTYKPMLVLSVFAAIFGFAMQSTAPKETTLGAVLRASDKPATKP